MTRTRSFKATLKFKVDKNHPDIKCIKNPDEPIKFSDTYRFNENYYNLNDIEEMEARAHSDLSIVAGGGYDAEHIHEISWEFEDLGFGHVQETVFNY